MFYKMNQQSFILSFFVFVVGVATVPVVVATEMNVLSEASRLVFDTLKNAVSQNFLETLAGSSDRGTTSNSKGLLRGGSFVEAVEGVTHNVFGGGLSAVGSSFGPFFKPQESNEDTSHSHQELQSKTSSPEFLNILSKTLLHGSGMPSDKTDLKNEVIFDENFSENIN